MCGITMSPAQYKVLTIKSCCIHNLLDLTSTKLGHTIGVTFQKAGVGISSITLCLNEQLVRLQRSHTLNHTNQNEASWNDCDHQRNTTCPFVASFKLILLWLFAQKLCSKVGSIRMIYSMPCLLSLPTFTGLPEQLWMRKLELNLETISIWY